MTNIKKNKVEYTVYLNMQPSSISPKYIEAILPNWKTVNESKTINGIACKKATRSLFGRKWVAWYSSKYPMPFGPYKFFGLPGLILRVEDETQSYIFEIISIIHRERKQPTTVHENIKIMNKGAAIKLYNNNRFSMARWNGAKMDPEIYKKLQSKAKEGQKNYNNPIELKPFEYK
ncbi:MAG: GLPGLI family protein [Niabella sp.]